MTDPHQLSVGDTIFLGRQEMFIAKITKTDDAKVWFKTILKVVPTDRVKEKTVVTINNRPYRDYQDYRTRPHRRQDNRLYFLNSQTNITFRKTTQEENAAIQAVLL